MTIAVMATVAGRYTFYHDSSWDTPTAEHADFNNDDVIAPDKVALTPGQTATFANYTSYSRGINGIMVDVAHLPEGVEDLTAADFEFRVGNDSTPDAWPLAPAPSDIDVQHGEGLDGSDRVTIIWADNAIEKQWLQVTVKATANTGLMQEDIFYFGNAIGESGNSATDAFVNATDQIDARNNPHFFFDPAPIDDRCDHDRDRNVNATDQIIARNNSTSFFNALKLISVPGIEGLSEGGAKELHAPNVSLTDIDWLCEVGPTSLRPEQHANSSSANEAVDTFLADYWPLAPS